jgi:hypothetical protein
MIQIASLDSDRWSFNTKRFHQRNLVGRSDTGLAKDCIANIFFISCSNCSPSNSASSTLLWVLQTATKLAFSRLCLKQNFLEASIAAWQWELHRTRWVHAASSKPLDSSKIIFWHSLFPCLQNIVFNSKMSVKFPGKFSILFMRLSSKLLYLIMLLVFVYEY